MRPAEGVAVSAVGKDPQWRVAERLAERHARAVLNRTEVRASGADAPAGVDVEGTSFVGSVERRRGPVDRPTVERLHDAAAGRTAAVYSRSGYTKTAVLWADEHHVALFGYTDSGYVAPLNLAARDVVQRAQADAEQRVRAATELISRHATQARLDAERADRERHAAALRAQEEAVRASTRRQIERERRETVLGRTVVLLLAMRLDADALPSAVRRLTETTVVTAVADEARRLAPTEVAPAVALVRALFHDAAATLEVLTPDHRRDSPNYRAGVRLLGRGLDALDAAGGVGGTGHVTPDDIERHLRDADRCWRALVGELVKAVPPPSPVLPTPHRAVGAR
jgi:hypothetical protein